MPTTVTTRRPSRAAMYGDLFTDTVLDDLDAEADALTVIFARARHRVEVTAHDRWHGEPAEIHAHLSAHPAF